MFKHLITVTALLFSGPVLADTIRIASWNIENFGKTKATDSARMAIIADRIKDYDIIAIQEVSNVKEQADPSCPRNENKCPGDSRCGLLRSALETHLNQTHNKNFKFLFSPHVKDERYLYIYNPDKVELISYGLVDDKNASKPICASSQSNVGRMVREPFRIYFKAGLFEFHLLTVHTSPSRNLKELKGLEKFYEEIWYNHDPDVIILGDVNADCDYLKDADKPKVFDRDYYWWVVNDDEDTTVSGTNCAYDRFIFSWPTGWNWTGKYGIVKNIPDNVSDHYLIWAEFDTTTDNDMR